MKLPLNVEKYFKKFGSDKWQVNSVSSKKYDNIIVIPALGELANIGRTISSLNNTGSKYFDRSLVLLVVNNTANVNQSIRNDNELTIEYLKQRSYQSRQRSSELQIAYVDASTPGNELDNKNGGVGLARKIGMDLALTLFDYGSSRKKLIICCDADCEVSSNYLSTIVEFFNDNNVNAGYVKFEHPIEDTGDERFAIVCYEIFLHYYVLALNYADSPYAIHSIGSTMVCDHEAYINVQGMNKRKAAEDFYFMEKLAKNYKVSPIRDAVVYPSGRKSWRVPFGTGQRINRFISKTTDEYQLYSPESFELLKQWNKFYYDPANIEAGILLRFANDTDEYLTKFLEVNNFKENFVNIINNSKSEIQVFQQKRRWFDGFKTLKLIHWLRDNKHPNINMFDALDDIFNKINVDRPVMRPKGKTPSLNDQIKYLELLRNLT